MQINTRTQSFEKYLLDVYRLKNVIRYNTRCKLKDESVAEHSFYVALFALKICEEYKINEQTTNLCLIKAILHDMPEIDLNDITHDVKERLKLRPFLKQYEDEYFEKHFKYYANIMTKSLPIVDTIVILADAWSVYQYSLNEIQLGNKSIEIEEIYDESKERIKKLEEHLKKELKDEQD